MKINLINMILHHAGKLPFDGIIIDKGHELDAAASLHTMILEYAKVCAGGSSDIVEVPERFRSPAAALLGIQLPDTGETP